MINIDLKSIVGRHPTLKAVVRVPDSMEEFFPRTKKLFYAMSRIIQLTSGNLSKYILKVVIVASI